MFAFISHQDCFGHDAGPMHPDTPDRLSAITNQMIASGLDFVIRHYDAPVVTRQQLERAHDVAYLDRVYAMDASTAPIEIDGDTVMSKGTLRAAERAAGAGVMGVDLIMSGEAHAGFCCVRPPGHHAEHNKAMGFCLFGNIAVAAAHAMEAHGLNRVAIVDFDVHHGNGTEDIFRHEPRVLFCSSFQHPFYPFTGHEAETSNLVDIPLKADSGSVEFREAVAAHWLPAIDDFAPEFLFISAGFDAHVMDDMSNLELMDSDYRWVTDELVKIARRHCNGRVLSMLEGGYEPPALARCVVSHIDAMIG